MCARRAFAAILYQGVLPMVFPGLLGFGGAFLGLGLSVLLCYVSFVSLDVSLPLFFSGRQRVPL